jgi:hypothetical protein
MTYTPAGPPPNCEGCPEAPGYCPGMYTPWICDVLRADAGHTPSPTPSPALVATAAGDLVAALARRIGADRAAAFVAAKLGVDCGCKGRQDALNRLDAKVRRYLSR